MNTQLILIDLLVILMLAGVSVFGWAIGQLLVDAFRRKPKPESNHESLARQASCYPHSEIIYRGRKVEPDPDIRYVEDEEPAKFERYRSCPECGIEVDVVADAWVFNPADEKTYHKSCFQTPNPNKFIGENPYLPTDYKAKLDAQWGRCMEEARLPKSKLMEGDWNDEPFFDFDRMFNEAVEFRIKPEPKPAKPAPKRCDECRRNPNVPMASVNGRDLCGWCAIREPKPDVKPCLKCGVGLYPHGRGTFLGTGPICAFCLIKLDNQLKAVR